MAKYSVQLNRAAASATLGIGCVQMTATLPRRMKVYDIMLSSENTPADVAVLWTVDRVSGAPTGGAGPAPSRLDPADGPALADSLELLTNNGTTGDNLLALALNQRASFRWVAAPGSELVTPATDNNGVEILTPTLNGGNPAITATILFEEQ